MLQRLAKETAKQVESSREELVVVLQCLAKLPDHWMPTSGTWFDCFVLLALPADTQQQTRRKSVRTIQDVEILIASKCLSTMIFHSVEQSYIKPIQTLAVRSFSRAPGSIRLPRLRPCARTAPQKSLHHLNQRCNAGVNRRLRVAVRHSWSKRLATLVETSKESTDVVTASSVAASSSEENSWAREAHTLPNLITCTRIASAPLLGYFIATDQTNYALMGCGIAAFSDWLDGHIARKYDLTTRLGSYLDPLGKAMMVLLLRRR